MTIPLRHARLDIVRWTNERDARAHLTAHCPDLPPFYIGEWRTDDRISSIIARDSAGQRIWVGLMAEGGSDPWIVPTFGGLLLVSNEGLLLTDDRARILAHESPFLDLCDVLVADTVVWIVGTSDLIRVTGTGCEVVQNGLGDWDRWSLQGDRIVVGIDGGSSEIVG